MTDVPHSRLALAMMCKAPISGASKTRLCPPLDFEDAARLSRCFIADVAATVAGISAAADVDGFVAYTPATAGTLLDEFVPRDIGRLEQRGADLGERMLQVSEDLFALGYTGVCLIGADSPTMPAALVMRALDVLRQGGDGAVIGPAIDGGYTLIGLKRRCSSLFTAISWSSSLVLAQTLDRAATARLPAVLLPPWYDVDDAATLRLLLHELFGSGIGLLEPTMSGGSAAHSRAFLAELMGRDNCLGWP